MELRHLRYFVAVGKELNFRRASKRLNISSPALSKQIQDLEEEVAVKLLDRNTKRVRLTKAGEVFLQDSIDILARSEQAIVRAREVYTGHRGELRIGSAGIISTDFLPQTVRAFRARYPMVDVTFVDLFPAEQLEALDAGEIDIAFAYGDENGDPDSGNSTCVMYSRYGLAVSEQHPFASLPSVSLAEIPRQNLLCIGNGEGSGHASAIERIFSEEGFDGISTQSINGFNSLVTLLAADEGVTLLPEVLDLSKQKIVVVPLEAVNAVLDFRMWAVWNGEYVSNHIRHFVELFDEIVTDHT